MAEKRDTHNAVSSNLLIISHIYQNNCYTYKAWVWDFLDTIDFGLKECNASHHREAGFMADPVHAVVSPQLHASAKLEMKISHQIQSPQYIG